jgi:hypothetical protein
MLRILARRPDRNSRAGRLGSDLKSNDLYFILAKVEAGAGDVPAAALDSQENKYLFVRYVEKSENLKILTSTLSRASDPVPNSK